MSTALPVAQLASRPAYSSTWWALLAAALRAALPTNRLARLWLAPAVAFVAVSIDRDFLTDLWPHLNCGRAIAAGNFPPAEQFTISLAGQRLLDPNWLTQWGMFQVFSQGGLSAIVPLNAALVALALGLVGWQARKLCGSSLLAAGLGLLSFGGLWQLLTIRPQTLSMVWFAALLVLLEVARKCPAWLFAPPLVLAAWVNTHGAFPIGLVLIGCYALEAAWNTVRATGLAPAPVLRRAIPWAACLLASALATCASPYGPQLYEYVLTTSAHSTARDVEEWRPARPDQLVGGLWLASIVLVGATLTVRRRAVGLLDLLLIGLFLPITFQAARMLVWWWLLLPTVLARLWRDRLAPALGDQPDDARPSWSAAGFCGALLIGVGLSLPCNESWSPLLTRGSQRYESELATLLEPLAKTPGPVRLWTRFEWAPFVVWNCPQAKVLVDTRMEIIPPELWQDYVAIASAAPGWPELADRYQFTHLLLDQRTHPALEAALASHPEWRPVATQRPAMLWERTLGPGQPPAAR